MHPVAIARRLIPEALRITISRHFPRDVRERLMSDQFRAATDWSRTTAFALPSAYTGFIRVNLRGRDPQGIIAPGRDYDELLDRLESDVWMLTDPESGTCPVASITRTARVFPAPSSLLPDLMIEWKPSRRFIDRLLHPAGELRQKKPEFFRDSDHSRVGFVTAAGPSIACGPLEDITPLDLAPTFLALLGELPA
jgi:predicted AlkP superfamily phosphohydrolase/phosphomutase